MKEKSRILVIYFSQTGQLRRILDSVCTEFGRDSEIDLSFAEIKMANPYPFPWSPVEFFDTFPEAVQGIPQEITYPEIDRSTKYDLIIVGYQTWYMSPCIPINSFLSHPETVELFKDQPVITVIGSRNMWLVGQEKMKKKLNDLGAKLVGNLAFVDKTPNLIGILTVIGWMMKGVKKGWLGFLPASGVSEKDILNAVQFGPMISKYAKAGAYVGLNDELQQAGAAEVHPKLLFLEKRANRLFGLWSRMMLKRGGPGHPKRKTLAKTLLYLIPFGALILAPITAISSIIVLLLNRSKFAQIKKDYAGVELVK